MSIGTSLIGTIGVQRVVEGAGARHIPLFAATYGFPIGKVGTIQAAEVEDPSPDQPEFPMSGQKDEEDRESGSVKDFPYLFEGVFDHSITYELDRATGTLRLLVLNRGSREVVCQIPPEAVETFVERYQEVRGLYIDEEA
jgi:uncharacterized FlaG/YvyC family protein